MIRKNKLYDLLLSILIVSPTLVILPQIISFLLLSLVGALFTFVDLKHNKFNKLQVLVLGLAILNTIVFYIFYSEAQNEVTKSINNFFPYILILLICITFSKHLNKGILYYVLILIVIEVFMGISQYAFGVKYFINPGGDIEASREASSNLFYYTRVYGLSTNASLLAQKVMVGYLLLYYLKIVKYKNLIFLILTVGLLLTFNRTAILATIAFLSIIYYRHIIRHFFKNPIKISLLFLCSVGVILFLVNIYIDEILLQFFRGQDGVELSYRDVVFSEFISFIKENPLLGNFGHKYWTVLRNGNIFHAHNSYLQTLANLGIIKTILLFVGIGIYFNKRNVAYLVPILIYSLVQYGILWGMSFLDIIFFFFLQNNQKINQNKS